MDRGACFLNSSELAGGKSKQWLYLIWIPAGVSEQDALLSPGRQMPDSSRAVYACCSCCLSSYSATVLASSYSPILIGGRFRLMGRGVPGRHGRNCVVCVRDRLPVNSLNLLSLEDAAVVAVFSALALNFSRMIAKLISAEKRLEYALETASDGFWDRNVKTGEVNFSPRWISSLGYELHELPTRVESWERLVHPEDIGRTKEVLLSAFGARHEGGISGEWVGDPAR
jgi:PAS domain-containing protein